MSQLINKSKEDARAAATDILDNNSAFVRAVQTYKNVVTHYFAAKTEIWMALYMKPVFGVTGGNLANKFAVSRGAIHFHSVLQAIPKALNIGGEELRTYAESIKDALLCVNAYIEDEYLSVHHEDF